MNIATIKTMDDGIGGVVIQGTIKKVMDSKNIKGTGTKGAYDFWSQFIIVEDASGDIGVSVNFNDNAFSFGPELVGTPVTLKGTVASYNGRDGLTKKLDRCKVVQATPAPPTQLTPATQEIIDSHLRPEQAAEQIQDHMGGTVKLTAQQAMNQPGGINRCPQPPMPTQEDYKAKEREKVLGMCFTNLLSGRLSAVCPTELEKDLGVIAALWRLSAICIDGTGQVQEIRSQKLPEPEF